jgi:pyridoxal 5'-phosphate synthase pdxT subunit
VAGAPVTGVLAYQGDVREHLRALAAVGADPREVRTLTDLDGIAGLVVPGGESTVIGKLAARFGLLEPLRERARAGLPVFGTCAGMIFLAREVEGPPQDLLGVLDVRVRRNAFGRQVASFEAEFDVKGVDGGPVSAAFIRAPWVAEAGPEVEVLAEVDGKVVAVRQGNLLATSFHPELSGELRLHRWFVDLARAAEARGVHGQPPDPGR